MTDPNYCPTVLSISTTELRRLPAASTRARWRPCADNGKYDADHDADQRNDIPTLKVIYPSLSNQPMTIAALCNFHGQSVTMMRALRSVSLRVGNDPLL